MWIKIGTNELFRPLAITSHAIPRRFSAPILTHVLLEAAGNRLVATSTDLEMWVRTEAACEIIEPGRVAVPHLQMMKAQSMAMEDWVHIRDEGERVLIRSGDFEAVLEMMDPEDFPPIPEVDGVALDLDIGFWEAIGQVAFAAADDDSRPALTGVLIEGSEEGLALVACDGYRLSAKRLPAPSPLFSALVPASAMKNLGRILWAEAQWGERKLTLTAGEQHVAFRLGRTTVVVRRVPAQFPKWQTVVPDGWTTRVRLDPKAVRNFRKALRKALSGSRRREAHACVLTASAMGLDVALGAIRIRLDAVVEGRTQEVRLNPNFLLDVLKALNGAAIQIEMTGSDKPVKIVPDGDSSVHVVMPILAP